MRAPRIAVYPGTFDPITLGHENLLQRCTQLFDEVIVAVAVAHHKKTLFHVQERVAMVQAVVAAYPQVRVLPFDGLVTHFAAQQGACAMVRGLRSGTDFDYEFQLADMNRALVAQVESVFLTPDSRYQSISSTLVREIAKLGGPAGQFVSAAVQARLLEKLGTSA